MAVSLIDPSLIACFNTGATLCMVSLLCLSEVPSGAIYLLGWVCRVDNDRFLGFIINN